MDCKSVRAAIERGAREEVESAEFRAHLLVCESCAEEWELIQGLREFGSTLTPEKVRELAGPCPTDEKLQALVSREVFGPTQVEQLRVHLLWCDACSAKHLALRRSLGREPEARPTD